MKKALLPLAVAASMLAGSALADYLPFTVNPAGIESTSLTPFVANGFTGQYVEVAKFEATSATGGLFSTQILYQINGLTDAAENTLDGTLITGLGSVYSLYALMSFDGTYGTSGATTTFNFTSGDLGVWYDPRNTLATLTTFTAIPTSPTGFPASWLSGGAADDVLLATGALNVGSGSVICKVGSNCGSFGVETSFALNAPDGDSFFTAPRPFHNLAIGNGQFDGFSLPTFGGAGNPLNVGFNRLSGSMNVHMSVPEPSTLALLGLGLTGLGLSLRRRKAA